MSLLLHSLYPLIPVPASEEPEVEATKAPLEAAKTAYDCLRVTPKLIENGNVQAISDLASGMYLLEAGMNCSILNVKINAGSLKDKEVANKFLNECAQLQKDARAIIEDNMKLIKKSPFIPNMR